MPTTVDRAAYERWRARMPPRLQNFVANFFGTCEPFESWENYLNYVNDIDLYALSAPVYRRHRSELLQAFVEITGFRPRRG